jgi:hypothetical protein
MLEALTTLTRPSQYQQGLNSLHILFSKAIGTPDEFIKKLFTVYSYDYVMRNSKEKVLKTLLRDFDEDIANALYDSNENYSFAK